MEEDRLRSKEVEEFIKGLRGCVKGSNIKPEELKRIWWMRD